MARIETRNSHNVLQRIITDSSDAIVVADESGTVIEMSARACDLFAIPAGRGGSVTLESCLPPELAAATRESIAAFRLGSAAPADRQELTFLVDGSARHVEFAVTPSRLESLHHRAGMADEIILSCITARDITLAREQQARLDRLARFDVLTGAMNRSELVVRLADAMTRPRPCRAAVLALNLDRFKTVNASLGRDVGDGLLCAVVERIGLLAPGFSGVSRLGADTFALFCTEIDEAGAQAAAEALNAAIAAPFILDGVSVRVGSRVGIALGDVDGDAASLLENAEQALDEARLDAEGCRVFDPASSARQARSRQIERALWSAIEHDELHLAYQPQIDLQRPPLFGGRGPGSLAASDDGPDLAGRVRGDRRSERFHRASWPLGSGTRLP